MTETSTNYEFHAVVKKVEERFAKNYAGSNLGEAKAEAAVEVDEVSTGWWVSFEGWPVAMRFGNLKPHINAGQTMIIEMRVKA
jgi:hypothetical protein